MSVGNGQASFPGAGLMYSFPDILLLLHFDKLIDIFFVWGMHLKAGGFVSN